MRRAALPATIVMTAVAAVVALPLFALAATAISTTSWLAMFGEPPVWMAVRFTLLQAGLTTLLSVSLAIPVSRALARRPIFPGRRLVLRLLTVPLAMPVLVAVFGIVAAWGRAGWFFALTGIQPNLYGLTGVLIAHVYFDLPFAILLLTARLQSIPAETWRLASQLGFSSTAVLRLIEWPAIRSALPGAAAITFLTAVTSFTVILTLGGGPWATTLEVAIYQSLRFDFDPPRAVLLSLLQMALCLLSVFVIRGTGAQMPPMSGLVRSNGRAGPQSPLGGMHDAIVIGAVALFVGLPIVAVGAAAIVRLPALWGDAWLVGRAAATSLSVALAAAMMSVTGAWSLVAAARSPTRIGRLARGLTANGAVVLVLPPFVIGAGWFLLLNRYDLAFALAPLVVIGVNALMSLPFSLRVMSDAEAATARDVNRLCANLGLTGWQRFRLIDWPRLRRSFAFAGSLAAALSLGDLGIAALFGNERLLTLPLLLQQRMGSYRQADAASLAGLLALMCLALFVIGDLIAGRERA